MKFTNKHNLPEHICAWLGFDEYDYQPGTISATTLIGPARAWALKQIHSEELEMDYSDMLALRYGTAIHDSLEKVGVYGEGDFKEKRFFAQKNGFTISGKPDALINGVIRDNKSTSVWKIIHGEFEDYIKQLSIYRWLLHKNEIDAADYAYIDFFFTDWKKSDAAKGGNYPQLRYQEQKIQLWTLEETESFLERRLAEFSFALSVLPECTPEELWQDPAKYAVYKSKNSARAYKLVDTAAEARNVADSVGGIVEYRPAKAKRCEYCTAAPFCEQCQKLKEAGLADVE